MSKKNRMYGELIRVLGMAYEQAAYGKGKERHANNKPFEEQTMMVANKITNGGFSWGQIFKKIQEIPNIQNLEMKQAEMISIIVYAAGWVLWHEGYMNEMKQASKPIEKGEARGNLVNPAGMVGSKDAGKGR